VVQLADDLGLELPDPGSNPGPWQRRDAINHQLARLAQTVLCRGNDRHPEQRRGRWIGRQAADGYGLCRFEAIILDDHGGPWFANLGATAGYRPDFSPFHSSKKSEMASMNAWSSSACGLLATASDWRRASAMNSGESTSGTQIWIGRNPRRRSSAL